jgi:hypothetical protein
MALYGPVSLMLVPIVWYVLVITGYMLMIWAVGVNPLGQAFLTSESSVSVLGSAPLQDQPAFTVEMTEALTTILLFALVIAYLPTLYSIFSMRQQAMTRLERRCGSDVTGTEIIAQLYKADTDFYDAMEHWETWFEDLEESHTSMSLIVFYRSSRPGIDWVTAAGAVLDTLALYLSTLDVKAVSHASFCFRAGCHALNEIAAEFNVGSSHPAARHDAIGVSRAEYECACDRLINAGIPLKPRRDQMWLAFYEHRVQYDTALQALASLAVMQVAPLITVPTRAGGPAASDRALNNATEGRP